MSAENLSGLAFLLLLFCFMFYTIVVGREVGDCRKELAALNDNMVTLIDLIQRTVNDRRDASTLEIRASALAHERIEQLRARHGGRMEKRTLVVNGEFIES